MVMADGVSTLTTVMAAIGGAGGLGGLWRIVAKEIGDRNKELAALRQEQEARRAAELSTLRKIGEEYASLRSKHELTENDLRHARDRLAEVTRERDEARQRYEALMQKVSKK